MTDRCCLPRLGLRIAALRIAALRIAALLALAAASACTASEHPDEVAQRAASATTAQAVAPAPAPWYRGARALDLTGDGAADSVRLEAVGARVDSLRITLALVVDGQVKHREAWGSSYELALLDSAARIRPGADATLRAKLDTVLASVVLERLDAPGVRLMAEDRAVLAGIEPRPTHRVSFSYGYESTARLAWDAPRARFVRLWSCC